MYGLRPVPFKLTHCGNFEMELPPRKLHAPSGEKALDFDPVSIYHEIYLG
jgi:hypothetical protein